MAENIISVKNLTKKFKDFTAVDNISFNVKRGEIFAFLGPNGAGKTTTIKMLTTLLSPTSGTAIASTLQDFQGFQLIMNLLVMPLFFLSGALFPLNSVPAVLKAIASIDPLSYGVDGLRSPLVNTTHFGLIR